MLWRGRVASALKRSLFVCAISNFITWTGLLLELHGLNAQTHWTRLGLSSGGVRLTLNLQLNFTILIILYDGRRRLTRLA